MATATTTTEEIDPITQHIESTAPNDASAYTSTKSAALANAAEHNITFWQALRKHRKAAMWSAIISLTIIMEGYDVGLIYQLFAYPAFKRTFGQYYPDIDGYQVSGPWQAGLSNGANAGIIVGGFANGYLSQKWGYKKVVLGSLFVLNWLIFIFFFAASPQVLLVGQILAGLTWGVFATSGPAYASEVCPLALRGYLTCYVNLCWCIGQLIAAGVLYGGLRLDSSWSYRLAYGVQWVWPLPLFAIILFAPESPWWLVRNNQFSEVEKALAQLGEEGDDGKRKIAQILHTLRLESAAEAGSNYIDCFKGTDLRRTEIVCVTFAGQVLAGSAFAYGPTYFFEQAGISTDNNYKIAIGGTSLAFVGNIISLFLLSRFGRRTLYLSGLLVCALDLLIIGILASTTSPGAQWGQVALCLIWLFVYTMTIGPICYTIISETSSLRLRAKSVCLSRNVYNMTQIVANVIQPYLMNPTEANLKGQTGFLWCGTGLLVFLWGYFRLPELRGRTYEEVDVMFHRGVSARKFAKYELDVYQEGEGEKVE